MQQGAIHSVGAHVHIAHGGASDKQVFHRLHVGVLVVVQTYDIIQLQIQVLVYGFQGAPDLYVVLQLHRDLLVNKGLEKTEKQHDVRWL